MLFTLQKIITSHLSLLTMRPQQTSKGPNFKSVITKTGKVMEIIYHVISPWPGVGWFFAYIPCLYLPPINAHQGMN